MGVILRSPEEPRLDSNAFIKVQRANAAYLKYLKKRALLENPEDDVGPDNDDAWLFEDLHVYLRLAQKARDKEQIIELIFEVRLVLLDLLRALIA